jgi:hypothetical protein
MKNIYYDIYLSFSGNINEKNEIYKNKEEDSYPENYLLDYPIEFNKDEKELHIILDKIPIQWITSLSLKYKNIMFEIKYFINNDKYILFISNGLLIQ